VNVRDKVLKLLHNPRVYLALWASAFSFFAVLLFSTSTSFLYPLTNADFINLDSNFFLYEANLWLQGQTPYLDFFDHKGLYHLAINALALLLGGRYALFVLQVLFGFVGVYFLFLAIRLLSGERKSLFLLTGFLYLSLYAMGSSGNVEGEWVLPYVSLAYYFYLKGMQKSSPWAFRLASFFAGVEVGCSLNSRPLDGIWGGVIAVSFFVYALRKKIGWELLYDALFAILGLGLVYALILPFAIQGGYLQAMMEAIFVDSFSYASSSAWNRGRWLNRLLIVLVYALGVLFFLYQKKKGDFDIALFFFVSASIAAPLYFIFARFTTYYWSGYTFYILNLVYAVSLLPLLGKAKKLSWASPLLYFWVTFVLVWSISLTSLYYTVGFRDFSYSSSMTTASFVRSIDEKERTKKGNVFALDCDAALYTIGGITTNEKYLVNQSNWATFVPGVKEELERYLSSPEKPHYLFVNENDPSTWSNFSAIIEANYSYSRRSDSGIALYLSK
jgi:hypothetical protein